MTIPATTHTHRTQPSQRRPTPPQAPPEQQPEPLPGKDAALAILRAGVADLVTSAGWKRALEFRRHFHTYSFFNTSLILAQHPSARLVAGYRTWQKLDRQVRKGERGLGILAPMLRRDPNDPDGDARILVGFRTVKVFDVSQTDGEPLPERPAPELLRDTPEALTKLRDLDRTLIAWCAGQGVRVTHDLQYPHALGVYRHAGPEIALRPDLSTVQSFKTLVHEVAHHLLHSREDERHTAELEAETTAFLVCDALGVDTGSYSFAYLAHWQKTLDELLHAGERASRAARTILAAVGRPQEHPLAHASGED
jgi:antirestriction protein ArdC